MEDQALTKLELWLASLPEEPPAVLPGKSLRLMIPGAPRQRRLEAYLVPNMLFPKLQPVEAYRNWSSAATASVLPVLERLRTYFPINYPVHLLAKFYRDAERGTLAGHIHGLAQFLEDCGVIKAEEVVRSTDGSRLLKDELVPRIEMWITPVSLESGIGLFDKKASEWATHDEPEPEAAATVEEAVPDREAAGARLQLFTRYGGERK